MDLATCERGRAFGPITAASAGLGVIGFMNAAFGFRFAFFFAGAFFAFAFGFAAFFLAFFFAAILVLLGYRSRRDVCSMGFRRAKAKVTQSARNRETRFSLGKLHFSPAESDELLPLLRSLDARPLSGGDAATRATPTSSHPSTRGE